MTPQKILLIEDDQTMLSLLRTLLRFEGFDVVQLESFNNIDNIMTDIHTERPDLILLDVNLQQCDGFELLYHIRHSEQSKNTCVLMSSGMDFSERCLEEGADGFILKPHMPEELIATIRKTLAN